MQFTVGFDCRECGHENRIRTDTALQGEPVEFGSCERCGHVSGILEFKYTYRAEHGPPGSGAQERKGDDTR